MTGRTLVVSLHGREVGCLWEDGEHSLFRFDEAYLDAPDRPVLGQWFEDRLLSTARRVRGMHPWFENALPEASGVLRRRLARGLGLDTSDSMGLLAALGGDLPGAVRVCPDEAAPRDAGVVDEMGGDAVVDARFSLGGVQIKFSMSGEPGRLAVGMTDPGGAAWILKVGTPDYPGLAENEHAVMSWCRAAGFDVPETHVVPLEDLPDLGPLPDTPTGFLVRRYDRGPQGRVHQEDFAQVFNVLPEQKYRAADAARLLDVARQILGPAGAEEGLRRLVAVVAQGNCDAHLKNWSLIYPDRITAAWSPLYDQVATVAYPQLDGVLALRIGAARHVHQVAREHLRWVGGKAGIPAVRCDEIVEETLEALRGAFASVGFPKPLAGRLGDHWARVPVLRGFGLSRRGPG